MNLIQELTVVESDKQALLDYIEDLQAKMKKADEEQLNIFVITIDLKNNTWCVNAFHGMSGNNDGTTKLCCMYKPAHGDPKLVLGEQTIDEHFNNKEFKLFRKGNSKKNFIRIIKSRKISYRNYHHGIADT